MAAQVVDFWKSFPPGNWRAFADWLADEDRCPVPEVRDAFEHEPEMRHREFIRAHHPEDAMTLTKKKRLARQRKLWRHHDSLRIEHARRLVLQLAPLQPKEQIAKLNDALAASGLSPVSVETVREEYARSQRTERERDADEVANQYIGEQAGDELLRRLKLHGDAALDYRTVLLSFLATGPCRQQRVLYGSVCALLRDDRQHAPESLARFVVHLLSRKVWPRVPAGLPFDFAAHFTRARRRSVIRERLRLPPLLRGRRHAVGRQRLRRYDRLFRAVVGRTELRTALLRLAERRTPIRLKRILEAAFRHIAAQSNPSLADTVKDIRALAPADLTTKHYRAASEINETVARFRQSRAEAFDAQAWQRYDKCGTGKSSIDALDRKARRELGLK